MELELAADADAVAGLARLKALTASRNGRPRIQAVKIVWHDSPEHALLADGMTLSEQRGVWRLERVVPGADTWLPGQPAPIVAESPDQAVLPSPLAPLAAFEGRRTTSVHQFGEASVTLIVEKGVLRTVAAEQQVARVLLSGEEQAVRSVATLIAGAAPVAVPLASLAAEGIALATGRAPTPRHNSAPVLPAGPLSVPEALAHIIGHLTDVVLANAQVIVRSGGVAPEAVHQTRVALRRARSALSVFRTAVPPGAFNVVRDGTKALGASLGPTRDWDVFMDETVPAIHQTLPGDERLERLVLAASRRRRACQKALAHYLASPAFRMLGIELAWFAAARFWHEPPALPEGTDAPPSLGEFAGQVLQHRWKKLVSSGKRIEELDIPSLHGVRLRGKQTRYAAEMFSALYPGKAAHRFIRRLSDLQQRLGVLNDGAVATHLLAELGGPAGKHAYATGLVVGFMAARAEKIRPRIIRAYGKFRRQAAYWT